MQILINNKKKKLISTILLLRLLTFFAISKSKKKIPLIVLRINNGKVFLKKKFREKPITITS
jgi:hypothetical protein